MSDVKGKTGAVLRETAVLTGAVAIIAAGVFFFLVPSHTSVSSISENAARQISSNRGGSITNTVTGRIIG